MLALVVKGRKRFGLGDGVGTLEGRPGLDGGMGRGGLGAGGLVDGFVLVRGA